MKDAIITLGWVTAEDYALAERLGACDAERCADAPFFCAWCLVRENEAEYRDIFLRPSRPELH
jgi:hypothetical protein